MRVSPPTLRRRNVARLKEHERWLLDRDLDSGTDSDVNYVSRNSGDSGSENSVDSDNGNSGISVGETSGDSGNERPVPPVRPSRPVRRRRVAERDVNSGTDGDGALGVNSGNSGASDNDNSANSGNDNYRLSDNDGSGDSDNENKPLSARPTPIGKSKVVKPTISPPVSRRWLFERGDDDGGIDSGDHADSEDSGDSDNEDVIPPVPNSHPSGTQPGIGQPSMSSVLSIFASPSPSTGIPPLAYLPAASAIAIDSRLPVLPQTTPAPALPTFGPGSTLQVGKAVAQPAQPVGEPAKEPEGESDSDVDGISSDDGDDSDEDETTTGVPSLTASITASGNVQTLTHIVPPNDRKSTLTSSTPIASVPTTTSSTLPLSTLPAAQVSPVPVAATSGGAARPTAVGETFGSEFGAQLGIEKTSMSGGDIAGVVVGVLAGVGFLSLIAFFLLRKMRGNKKNLFTRNLPDDADPRSKTFGTTWSRSLWDATSSFAAPKSTSPPPPNPKTFYNSKTNSEMIDDLVKASYAAEDGTVNNMETATYPFEQKLKRQSDLESQFPPSPTSFLNEKAYNALEVWPPYAPPTPAKLKRSSKPPAVTRWLDGILTPRLSRTGGFRPQGTMQGTRWQETGPDGLHGLVPPPPVPGFGKEGGGRGKSGRMTVGTTVTDTTASSVVW